MLNTHKNSAQEWQLLEDDERASISTEELDVGRPGKVAFLLHNVLSPSECEQLISWTEKKGYRNTGYHPGYRSNTRVIIDDEDLMQLIWQRVKSFVPSTWGYEDFTWDAVGLNERWRFCRYVKGQHFDAHNDACFRRSDKERSFLTFMLYLNDVCEGGTTNFLTTKPKLKVAPKAGTALVFQHNIYHEGEELRDGKKYIMRSDVMYLQSEE
ncbi:Prolyl 4hydroxylase, alpha subunit [Balamuthia mandrillaris]